MGLLVSLFYIVYLLVFLHLCHCILKPPTCVWVHPTLRTDTYFFYLYIFYRPSAIPGPIPDELVVPTTNSIGIICSNVFLVIFELIYVPLIVCYIVPCLNRYDIANENGLAPRTLHQGFTCWFFIWYAFCLLEEVCLFFFNYSFVCLVSLASLSICGPSFGLSSCMIQPRVPCYSSFWAC